MSKYIYPAIFNYADGGISVEFPDLPGAFTCGDTEEETLHMAKDCLALYLSGMERDEIPQPSIIRGITVESAKSSCCNS
jgi:predicted RNase H-like HicB family nuclease